MDLPDFWRGDSPHLLDFIEKWNLNCAMMASTSFKYTLNKFTIVIKCLVSSDERNVLSAPIRISRSFISFVHCLIARSQIVFRIPLKNQKRFPTRLSVKFLPVLFWHKPVCRIYRESIAAKNIFFSLIQHQISQFCDVRENLTRLRTVNPALFWLWLCLPNKTRWTRL